MTSPLRGCPNGNPEEKYFAPEPPIWGPPGLRLGTPVTFPKFLAKVARVREDEVGRFARMAERDPSFPRDPTTILSYLARHFTPSATLAVARALVKEFRADERSALERDISEVARANPERAAALREALHESRTMVDRLYVEDSRA